jgi:Acid phosphatase (class B)
MGHISRQLIDIHMSKVKEGKCIVVIGNRTTGFIEPIEKNMKIDFHGIKHTYEDSLNNLAINL